MSTPVKKKLESKGTSENAAHNAAGLPRLTHVADTKLANYGMHQSLCGVRTHYHNTAYRAEEATCKKCQAARTNGGGFHPKPQQEHVADPPDRPFQRNALKKLSSKQLDGEIRASAKNWHMLTRKAQALERERLLPVIKEVARRIKAGKTVAGYTGIESYIKSLGLPPSLVRKWRFRERKKNGKKSLAALMQNEDALTHGGYYRKDITSWFHKALRRGDEDAALFCASELDLTGLQGHVWNTLILTASEDVGLADNSLAVQLLGLFKNSKALGDDVEMARHFLLDAVLLVARAKKNRVADEALCTIYGNAIPEAAAESLLVEAVKLEKEGRSGEAWNKLTRIARDADVAVAVQIHALHEHWKRSGGKNYEESENRAPNRLFLIHAALICERAEKTRQTERIYADRKKRKIPGYALDYHSRTGKKDYKRTKYSAEGVRHFLEEGATLENEDTSIPNPYRPHFEKWIWSKVKKAQGTAAVAGR
jgi:hypothetical protein